MLISSGGRGDEWSRGVKVVTGEVYCAEFLIMESSVAGPEWALITLFCCEFAVVVVIGRGRYLR